MLTHQKLIGTIGYMGGVMSLPEPFAWSWGNMLSYTKEALCQPNEHVLAEKTKLSLHDWARNELVSRMQGDWLLMFDTDVAFEPDMAARLVMTMTRYDVDVLTGIYCYKSPPHFPVLYVWNPETEKHETIAKWPRNQDLIPVSSAGGGCLLVRRRVFERITSELNENPFDRYPGKGEDHSFFMRLRKLGIKPACAWKIEMQHLEYVGLTPSQNYIEPEEGSHEFEMEGFAIAR